MPPREKRSKGWRKSKTIEADQDLALLRNLSARQLRDIETCRMVWQRELNPIAVCEAIAQSNLPDWLESAVLMLLSDAGGLYQKKVARHLWSECERNATDGARARAYLRVRTAGETPLTWDESFGLGQAILGKQYSAVPAVTIAGAKKSLQRVRRRSSEPLMYYIARTSTIERIDAAWRTVAALIQDRLRREKRVVTRG